MTDGAVGVGFGAPKPSMLPLGSPSFSVLLLKEKDLAEEFGSGTMYENVAPHAWSRPNFPHTHREVKARYAPRNGTPNFGLKHEHREHVCLPSSLFSDLPRFSTRAT